MIPLLAEGRTLSAKDIFTGKAYGDIITRHVTNQFKKADLEPFAKLAEVRALLLDPQNWALSPKGLEIIITPDSLFSHAVGSRKSRPSRGKPSRANSLRWQRSCLGNKPRRTRYSDANVITLKTLVGGSKSR